MSGQRRARPQGAAGRVRAAGSSRQAFVLGGGGLLGFAWMVGALSAFQTATGLDPRDARYVVGTSAGSALAALIASGLSLDEIRRHHQGVPLPADPQITWDYEDSAGGSLPPRPRWLPGSPRLIVNAARHPRRIRPLVAVSGVLPAGRGTLAPLRAMIDGVTSGAGYDLDSDHGWPAAPRPWVVTTDYRTGRRVVFGRDRTAPLGEAVVASCSIPGWYRPAEIDGRRYVDGGVYSNASVDLLLGTSIQEVFVFAPMVSVGPLARASTLAGRAERTVRRAVTRGVVADVQRLRSDGKRVELFCPVERDLEAMGVNLMNSSRRATVLDTAVETTAEALRDLPSARRQSDWDVDRGSA